MTSVELFSQAGDSVKGWGLFLDTSSHNGQMLAFNNELKPIHDFRWGQEERHDKVLNSYFSKITAHLNLKDLNTIICVQGPGSFTGLRLAAIFCKTLSLALGGLPVLGVSGFIIPAIAVYEQKLVQQKLPFSIHIPSIQNMTFLADFKYDKENLSYIENIDKTNAKLREKKSTHEFILAEKNSKTKTGLVSVPENYHDHSLTLFKKTCPFSYHLEKSSYLDFYPLFLRRSEAEEKFNYDTKTQ